MPASETILVAGIGNVFLGDDAFGVEVVRKLAGRSLPGVTVRDFGIRGFDLAYALMEHPAAVLIDAASRGGAPGTLYALEVDLADAGGATIETHAMDPVKVLRLAAALGGTPGRVFVVACEPATTEMDPGGRACLSAPVAAALEAAVEIVISLVGRIRAEMPGAAEPAHA